MARDFVSAIFDGVGGNLTYAADRGTQVPGVSFRFKRPGDFSDAQVAAVLTAVGAREKTDADNAICPVASEFKPRKLVFKRQSGGSFSVVLPDRVNAIAAATAIRTAAGTDDPVLCIELQGEEWYDLRPELNTTATAPTAGLSSASDTGKQSMHAGKILYQFDGGNGNTVIQAVKVDTDVVDGDGLTSPPSILGTEWNNCVGAFEAPNPCRSQQGRGHRRYIATMLTSADPTDPLIPTNYETKEIPVRAFDAPDVSACGVALADLASTTCLAYKGEDNSKFHLLLS